MKQAAKYILTVILMFIVFSVIVKIVFLYYNAKLCPFQLTDVFSVIWHGLFMDISMSVIIAAFSWLVTVLALFIPRFPLRSVLAPWYMIQTFLLAFLFWGDVMLYEAWGFNINYAVFSYMSSPGEGTASLTWWFIISRALLVLGTMAVLGGGLIWATPKRLTLNEGSKTRLWKSALLTLLLCLLGSVYFFVPKDCCLRGYYCDRLLLNNATQNPYYTLMVSGIESNKDLSNQFQTMEQDEAEEYFHGLYPATEGITDTLLKTSSPNVLIVQLESQSSIFIEELGGIKGVTPRQGQLIDEGILFECVYANSFRTDRGTVCTFSGNISYPTTSLMLTPETYAKLPSLAKSLSSAGYTAEYVYGGNLKGMQADKYLYAMGYTRQTDMHQFAPKGTKIVSAAPDSLSAQHIFQLIKHKPLDEKWHIAYQTITSHEPFRAPSRTLDNDTLNVFAYTDAAIGRLVDSLKTIPHVWNNLLMVLIPDHGCMFHRSYEEPDYFHIPMIWCGGALREGGVRVDKIMNQSDMAATLLAQLGIPHSDYSWSRNVFSPAYTHPSAYSTWPSGYIFVDETGTSSYDLFGDYIIHGGDSTFMSKRLAHGQAVLQTSYRKLERLITK